MTSQLTADDDSAQTPCWYYEKQDLRRTPSILAGMTQNTENALRNQGAKFIMACVKKLNLKCECCATGIVFFHRFYMIHSFTDYPHYVTAACCLFLAGKVEEMPKKCRQIVEVAKSCLKDAEFTAQFKSDPKEKILVLERTLVKTLKFDFQVDHPYTYLSAYIEKIRHPDHKKLQHLLQNTWNFVNDSLRTSLCLQWEPEAIACALLYLACKIHNFNIDNWTGKHTSTSSSSSGDNKSNDKWWASFVDGITIEIMEDICHQVLDLYSPEAEAPPNQQQQTQQTTVSSSTTTPASIPSTPTTPSTSSA